MMVFPISRLRIGLLAITFSALAGCGGGGGSNSVDLLATDNLVSTQDSPPVGSV